MATQQECERALRQLSTIIAGSGGSNGSLERSVSCRITDLGVVFSGELHDGQLEDVAQPTRRPRLRPTSNWRPPVTT